MWRVEKRKQEPGSGSESKRGAAMVAGHAAEINRSRLQRGHLNTRPGSATNTPATSTQRCSLCASTIEAAIGKKVERVRNPVRRRTVALVIVHAGSIASLALPCEQRVISKPASETSGNRDDCQVTANSHRSITLSGAQRSLKHCRHAGFNHA